MSAAAVPGLALALAVGLTACSSASGSATGANAGAGSGHPVSGGTLSIDIASAPLCLDPQNNNSNGNTAVSRQLVDSLTDQDPATGAVHPWLASSFKVNADATQFTFTLRSGATFSDGAPVDAAAVKANFDSIVKLGAVDAVGSSYLTGYQSTRVVDSSTAVVTFAQPNAQFLQATSTAALGLLSPASLTGSPEDRCQGHGLAGSGPFVLKSSGGQEIRLDRRTGYAWGSSLWKHTGAAYLSEIDYKVVPEGSVRAGSLVSGQVDGIIGVQPQDEKLLAGGSVTELVRSTPGVDYNLTPNTTRPLLSDVNVRKAISDGINRQQIVSSLLSSHYKPATSILSSTTPYYSDLSADLAYAPGTARSLLDADGWKPGSDGIRTKGGVRLTVKLVYPGVDIPSRNVLQLVQQQLKAVGIDAQLDGLPLNQLAPAQNAGQYDLLWFGLTRSDPDILRTSYSVAAKNRAHLAAGNPLEQLLGKQAATVDRTQRQTLVTEAQKQLVDQAYAIPVYEQVQFAAFGSTVHGAALDGSAQPELFDTWISGSH
ncbi:ABC transporter substrate-binding protein [Streptacidiphilus sp. N1-10]|uniref:ABC transporter substrate-binding protein n=1 Tax=Streptacidiphilus jeojiensis TaxID=3229225 RepID=A0ABV6XIB2_9ACTN